MSVFAHDSAQVQHFTILVSGEKTAIRSDVRNQESKRVGSEIKHSDTHHAQVRVEASDAVVLLAEIGPIQSKS